MSVKVSETVIIGPKVWIMAEGLPNYFCIYKLLKGKVSIHSSDQKIAEVEVKKGGKPIILGMIAALRHDRKHIASVRTETEVEAIRIYIDQARGILSNEVPKKLRGDVAMMIDAIVLKNDIKSMQQKLAKFAPIKPKLPKTVRPDVRELVNELIKLYQEVVISPDR